MANYLFRQLAPSDMKQMHTSFLEAFNDYPVAMKPSYSDFESRMLYRLNIAFDYSVGVFSGEKLIAFLFNAFNTFERIPTLYNGGTGVIPGHRGKKLTVKMYKFLRSKELPGGGRFLLETLSSNLAAIDVYKKIGFKNRRFLFCFRQESEQIPVANKSYVVRMAPLDEIATYSSFDSVEGCFSDSLQQLFFNKEQEKVLLCSFEDEVLGYLIFQPGQGRISRMAVGPRYRRKQVGSFLLNQAFIQNGNKPLYVINVPEEAEDVQQFLINRGFENQVNQWEMELFV